MAQFKEIVNMIHRFEKAVKEHQVSLMFQRSRKEPEVNRKEMEYHASKTELLNIASRLGKWGKSDD